MTDVRKELPTGVQVFEKLIQKGSVYVDKTEEIFDILKKRDRTCFFARPRRFGKSLLLSTLEAIFRGRRDLFKGTWIDQHSDYDWESSPVIALDFSYLDSSSPQALAGALNRHIADVAELLGVSLDVRPTPAESLFRLTRLLLDQGQPVILIDEYDAPLVKNLHSSKLTKENRAILSDFFRMLKVLQKHVRFAFITGVTQFSKMSLFSGLNNFDDLSFQPEFSALLGWTQEEIAHFCGPHLQEMASKLGVSVAQVLEEMKDWYNGYRFAPEGTTVFNPWSVICALEAKKFDNYWFASATPTFLIEKIQEKGWTLSKLEAHIVAGSEIRTNWDPSKISLIPLLYQSGYLTIESQDPMTKSYFLKPPNEEVLRSLVDYLLVASTEGDPSAYQDLRQQFIDSLKAGDLEQLFEIFNTLLGTISYHLHAPKEQYYHSLLHMCLRSLGFPVNAEVQTNRGRIDMVIDLTDRIYLLEFKIDQPVEGAIEQMRATDYAEPYLQEGKPIELVGVRFSSESRSVQEWKCEPL